METYYELLKLDKKATTAEVVQAYTAAKNAFSKDSLATYSLFSPEEAKEILTKLEEAYLTLSNLDRRREYDLHLQDPTTGSLNRPLEENAQGSGLSQPANASSRPVVAPAPAMDIPAEMTGGFLRSLRDAHGLSLEDVSRITKIPTKFLKAMENDDPAQMPARVYLQGFVKNLAVLYKINAAEAARSYLTFVDKILPKKP